MNGHTEFTQHGVSDVSNVSTEVQGLLHRLVLLIPPNAAELSATIDPIDEVILDIEVDDARYLLIRRPIHRSTSHVRLSPREYEVARMVAKGYPNKMIAAVLDISSWTVGTHLRRIFSKLGVSSRAAMVARLLDEDLADERVRHPHLEKRGR